MAVAALVYPVNPVRTPVPELLPIADVTTVLSARSCVDGACTARAIADQNGDFTAPVRTPAFAETSARYHTAKALAFFRDLGVAIPAKLDLVVEEPAFTVGFVPATSTIHFGRGDVIDFAYDADVVSHETAHAVLAATRASGWRLEEHGASNEPDAIDEAVADYFAAVITGDAIVGEYVGEESAVPVRSLDANARCPDAITGHAHADSLVASTVLWRTRATRGVAFDGELVRALRKDSSFAELGARLGLADALPRCVPVRDVTPEQTASAAQIGFAAPGTKRFAGAGAGVAIAPSVVQFRARVPEGAGVLAVRFGGTAFAAKVVARFDAPIRWTPAHDGVESVVEANRADVPIPGGTREVYFAIANAGEDDGEYDFVGIAFGDATPAVPSADVYAKGGGCTLAPDASRPGAPPGGIIFFLLAPSLVRTVPRIRRWRSASRCS